MKAALRDATNSTGNNSSADSETPSDEDYDTLTPDHEAILPTVPTRAATVLVKFRRKSTKPMKRSWQATTDQL